MSDPNTSMADVLDLSELSPDRRAASLARAFRFLSPDEELVVVGTGDPNRYERTLGSQFADGVVWSIDSASNGRWRARVRKSTI